ncbi:putative iron ABC transporter ATP-binding protein [Agrobacterium rubi TR3 = NBRC 13261]|uniref:Putative iron ABC transporter ATP-binding protein n=1 Tax=Agrobacterium rubi TR3 = NBRC 13261 TaxID=1368415 RepID=A0A081CUM0_9HYPH|nr:ABC transporter ATP-binding protein [Agrobacterium rubi]MBP1879219.1 iron(III) transport system ATP-binding protein [Agrobacterium rubi]MCL6652517.1 iron ABC transporter ATP-binding protein [Agrobacterium rubi]GAK70366.1 putative iron ABC transporter ATP-binding protein [Agrobacterium rubi TR3 = NBRC 13261]
MPDTAALHLSTIGKRFGDVSVLEGIDLTVMRGEIICLVGRSGCGKSTLLRIIAGVETPDAGAVFMNGREIAGPTTFMEPEKRRIGFVFQDYALFPHLTVEQNVLFGLKGQPKAQARARAAAMIEHVRLADLAKRYPHTLSGGEQQRVALARALAPKPDILLMDEPFSNLDRGLRDSVREETLGLLRDLETTAIMVTHDPEEALSAGDRVVLMQQGRIVQTGTGYELHDNPVSRYAADFFCAFNKVEGTVRNGHLETPIGSFAHKGDLREGTKGFAYIRPSAITISPSDAGAEISGRITSRVFMGEIEQVAVSVDGLAQDLRVRSMRRTPVDVETVNLSVARDTVLTFTPD